MAKIRAYIRIAKNGWKYKIDAGAKDNSAPLHLTGYRNEKTFLPTVAFAVDLNIPDELFSKASRVIGEINIALKDAVIASDVVVPSGKK